MVLSCSYVVYSAVPEIYHVNKTGNVRRLGVSPTERTGLACENDQAQKAKLLTLIEVNKRTAEGRRRRGESRGKYQDRETRLRFNAVAQNDFLIFFLIPRPGTFPLFTPAP